MNYRISDFCHQVPGDNGFVALYNALTLGVVIVEKKIAYFLASAPGKIFSIHEADSIAGDETNSLLKQLKKQRLIFPLGRRRDQADYLEIQKGLEIKRIGILYLLLTDACNLACRYCFVENGMPADHQAKKMTPETAKWALRMFAKSLTASHGVEEPQIILYGGEPTMNLPVMGTVFDFVEELKQTGQLPQNTSITLNTNGTLINENVIKVLKRGKNLNIAISLDGDSDINNQCRVYHNGNGTYDNIVAAYQLLKNNGLEAGLCCTINKYNVDQLEQLSHWFVETFGIRSMGFNLLIENCGIEQVRGDATEYAQKATQGIINCFKYFREQGIYEDRVMRKVNAFADGFIYYYDCGGCGQQLVVSPDGLVGVCQGYCGSKKYFIKPGDDFDPLQHPIWDLWRHRSPLYMPQCYNCIALSVCGGGCPYSAEQKHGDIWQLDDGFCIHAKETVEFLIKDLIAQMMKN